MCNTSLLLINSVLHHVHLRYGNNERNTINLNHNEFCKYSKLCEFQNNFFLLFVTENLSMIVFVSRDCRRPDSMNNNESEFNLVCPVVDLR